MLRALNSAASAMNVQMQKMDIIACNVANVNTTAYKKDTAIFAEAASQEMNNYGIPISNNVQQQTVGGGAMITAVVKNYTPGDVIKTDRPLDLAVNGEGFFKVVLPGGEERYTRDGYFTLNQDGSLVTPTGYTLEGVQLPANPGKIVITQSGTVFTGEEGSTTEAGQIQLYKFSSMTGLKPEGNNLYSLVSGEAQAGVPGEDGYGTVNQGCLETSNVDLLEETVNLIEAQRAYGFSSRVIKTADEMWGLANNMRK
ncbi:flagellar hook-basal body protein [Pelotomaculum propionicicum]|uniref:Flagellar basal-body rod protein FlgG n=1 Tax=Pelotomaculum propionicicum TaxID=258475 RepID=A0A4Y7RS93_9FIRM|nr:flagellar hook-basal body complex protein [Pelotomaculum propionicicum]TEB11137.1 Flagellar basal-body rod protein FlgG [Pelotomaculum propionicicum]